MPAPTLVYIKIHESYFARSKKPVINSRRRLIGSEIIRRFGNKLKGKERKKKESTISRQKVAASSGTGGVATSIGPLARTLVYEEWREPCIEVLARAQIHGGCDYFVSFFFLLGCARRRSAEKCTIADSRFSSSIDEDESGQFVSPRGARSQKPGDHCSS